MYLYNKKLIKEFIEDKNNIKKIVRIYISSIYPKHNLYKKIIYNLKQYNIPIHILDNNIFKKKFNF